MYACECVSVCVRACVYACVCVCVRACVRPHLLPDEVVAEEAAHLPLGQGASGVGVEVARQQVHAQQLNVTAVQSTAAHRYTTHHNVQRSNTRPMTDRYCWKRGFTGRWDKDPEPAGFGTE